MARRQRTDGGGIAGLRQLIAEHSEAVEYTLITLGLRLEWLGTDALTWRDLLVIVHQSPSDSPLALASDPDNRWQLREQLLAGIFDVLNVLAWQNTEDGQNGRRPPMPLPRPGVEPTTTTYGNGAMTLEEAEAWLRARNPLQHGG